jgi:transposase InsO family protein
MNLHRNARTTPISRAEMVRRVLFGGQGQGEVAAAFATTAKTVGKWIDRYQADGLAGLEDRSSRPRRLRDPTPAPVVERIIELRRQRVTGEEIAKGTGVSPATVSRVLKAAGLSRMRDLVPPEPVRRYERETPGELIHLDIKKLGKFEHVGHRMTGDRTVKSRKVGWEFVHVCIDDASRVAFSLILPDEKKESAIIFLRAALAYYESLGVTVSRVMTDNGSCYRSKAFRKACVKAGLKHIRTKPYTPKTNGKAERFIQTSLREWAYVFAYQTSYQRQQQLPT